MDEKRQTFQMQKKALDEITSSLKPIKDLVDSLKPLKNIEKVMIKGDKGDTPSEADIIKVVKPLIPKPLKGDKGEPFKFNDFTEKQLASLRGEDGEVDYGKVEAFVIKKVKEEVSKIPPAKPGKDAEIDIDKITASVLDKLPKQKDIEIDYPSIGDFVKKEIDLANERSPKIIRQFGGGGTKRMDELSDVSTSNLAVGDALVWNGSSWVNRPISGSMTTEAIDVANVSQDGENVLIDLSGLFHPYSSLLFVTRQGQILTPTTDYTVANGIITVLNSWYEDVFLITYTY